jgi:hypothetical protein
MKEETIMALAPLKADRVAISKLAIIFKNVALMPLAECRASR